LRDTSDTEHTLGAICWDERKDEEAAAHYLRALQIGPENSSIWMSLGFCYREQKLASKALNVYRRGLHASGKELAQDPRNARAHASQAYFEAMLHDPARAEEDAAESLKLSHDDDTTQFAVMTYEAIGRRDLALQVLETYPDVITELRRYPWLASLRFAVNKGAKLQ
jgi:tetratricopeptide (TPR) repeat protein